MTDSSDILEIAYPVEATRVLELTLNRPDRKNAINLALYRALTQAITEASSDPKVRTIIITGGEYCFTSGNDLKDFAASGDFTGGPAVQFMQALIKCSKPVIAAVAGPAIGIGTTMLMHCDFVFASPNAEFKLPFVSLGLRPEFGATYLLPKIVGRIKAKEWLLTGRSIPSQEALDAGLINSVCEAPLETARLQAADLSNLPPGALRETRRLMNLPDREQLEQAIRDELQSFEQALASPEFAEAASAFFEKRTPDFSSFE